MACDTNRAVQDAGPTCPEDGPPLCLAKQAREAVFAAAADWSAVRLLGGGSLLETPPPRSSGFDSYVHPEDWTRVWAAIQDSVSRGSVVELEHRLRWPDGDVSWVYSRAVPLVAENGDITEWLGAMSELAA